jgi:2Fe-2S ferredoxin
MNEEREGIVFTVFYNKENQVVKTYRNEYRNLMALLKDKIYPEFFGECGGMGRCGTCLITISGLPDKLRDSFRNEQSTLSKMGISDPAVRLSCQVQIDDDLNNAVVAVLDG